MTKTIPCAIVAAFLWVSTLAAQQPGPKKDSPLKVTGELTAKDPSDRMRPGCHHKVHKFELKEGIRYIIDLVQLPDPKAVKTIDPYLRLEDADGTNLAEDDDSGGRPNAALVFTPKKTATYRLIVTTCEKGQTGQYLLEAQPFDGAIRLGRSLNAQPDPSRQWNFSGNVTATSPTDPKREGFRHAVWTYPMNKGTRYLIGLNTNYFLPYLRLEDAAGNELKKDFTLDGFQHTLFSYVAKETGTYRVVVSSTEPEGIGFFESYVRPMNPEEPAPVKSIRYLHPNGFLTKDDKMDPQRPGRYHKAHTFSASAGTRYAVSMSGNSLDPKGQPLVFGPYLRVEDPSGTIVKDDDDRDDVQRPLIVFRAEQTGKYRVVASSFEAGKTGNYYLQIRPLSPAEPAPKKEFNSLQMGYVQLLNTDPVDKHRKGCYHKAYPFRMKAGVRYLIDATGQQNNSEILDTCLRLEDAKGEKLAEDDLSEGNDDPRLVVKAKETGAHRIVVSSLEPGDIGIFTLNVRALAEKEVPPSPSSSGGYTQPLSPQEFGDIVITPAPNAFSNSGGGSNDETHGYVEFRFRVENRSETQAHRVKLTIPRYYMGRGWGHHLQSMKRVAELEPGASLSLSLFQPDLTMVDRDMEVEIDGSQKKSMSAGLSTNRGQRFSNMHRGGRGPGSGGQLHLLAPADMSERLRTNVFKTAVGRPPTTRRSSGGTSSSYKGIAYHYQQIHQFHGLPLLANSWSSNWLGYSYYDGVVISGRHLKDMEAEVKNALWQYVECGGSLVLLGEGTLPESWQRSKSEGKKWDEYYPGFGQCLVFSKSRIRSLKPEQWAAIADMWEIGDRPWDKIRSPSEAQRDFPAVDHQGIPVRSLFVVMLVFAILIGPVNIRVLTRKKRRIWLLWTVPSFSLLTCVLIVGFMFLSEGWQGKVRAEGLVFLDESAQRASSLGWLGLYTPVAGDGLHFSQETEITPHLRMERWTNSRHPRTMDWSNDQHLDSGWISPRLPAHFMVRSGEKRLERILTRWGNDGSLYMTNGLKAPIKTIWLADKKGRVFKASDVPEGGEAVLKITELKINSQPGALRKIFGEDWYRLGKICTDRTEDFLRPGCYLAILEGAPFMEKGLSGAQLRPEPTAVFGILKEPL